MSVPLRHGRLWPRPEVWKIQPVPLLLLPPQYHPFHLPSAAVPSTHSIQEAPSLPILAFSVTLIFIHLILHHFCRYWCVFLFYKTALLTLKNAFISVVFDFSFSFVPSLPLPISPKPMGEIWSLSQWMDPSLPHSLFSVHISQTQVPLEAQEHWPKYLMGSSAWGPHVNSKSTHMVYIVLSIHWKNGTCQASINSRPDVNFLIERKSDILVRLFF